MSAESEKKDLLNLISQALMGTDKYESLNAAKASDVRTVMRDFLILTADLDQVYRNIQNDQLSHYQVRALNFLLEHDSVKEGMIQNYAELVDVDQNDQVSRTEGYKLFMVIEEYKKYLQKKQLDSEQPDDLTDAALKEMGDYKASIDYLDTHRRVQERLNIKDGRRRHDAAPSPIAPWQCRIGASTFYVPPTSISVNQTYETSSLGGAALRQPNSPKMNMGHAETIITMTLYFPTHETIWGFDGDKAEWQFHNWDPTSQFNTSPDDEVSDQIIDKYLSSLRGLITQFKYTPFLPVDNVYLNRSHDIDAVALKSMTLSTVQGFPFVIAATLQMAKFNYNPYMPMIDHFDQAIHWGKFRCYSDDTEVLTREGWKLFKEVDIERDLFATRSPEKKFEWQKATDYTCDYYSGELIHFKGRSIDLMVTPNHRMLVMKEGRKRVRPGSDERYGDEEVFIEARDLISKSTLHKFLPATSIWEGTPIEEFKLEKKHPQSYAFECSGDDYAAFMGMYLSEGSVSKGLKCNHRNRVSISQYEKSKGFGPFKELLTRIIGRTPCHDGINFEFSNGGLADFLRPFGYSYEKYIPDDIMNASIEQLQIFWDYYLLGDGNTDRKVESISSTSRIMADQLQEIAQKLGYSAMVRYQPETIGGQILGRDITGSRPRYKVAIRNTQNQSIPGHSLVPYNGNVFCVSVPNSTLYVRRNRKPSWCGNSMLGRGAIHLDQRVNKSFLQEVVETSYAGYGPNGPEYNENTVVRDEQLRMPLNKARDISDGRNFDIYYPVGTPSKIFTADTSDFRQPGEDEVFGQDYWDFILSDLGFDLVDRPEFNFFEFDTRRRASTNERDVLLSYLDANKLIWETMTSPQQSKFLEEAIAKGKKEGTIYPENEQAIRARYRMEWFYVLFDNILANDPIFQKVKASRDAKKTEYIIKEWEVPMAKVAIDWSRCIVEGVAVSMSNTFAKLQLQLQEEPTYQHIGGGDSGIDVQMIVLGDDNLIKLRRVFQHINGLARLERQHGVLGFLGFRNILTALSGLKYGLPTEFSVETIPGYPDCYRVRLSFVDFDVMQQQREKLDSSQQQQLIDEFGKANPFLRIKQQWSEVNCYPEFPLDVRDDDGKIIGHLDPDWYFRSFTQNNEDLLHWGVSSRVVALVQEYAELQTIINRGASSSTQVNYHVRLAEIEKELRQAAQNKDPFPPGWQIGDDGKLTLIEDENRTDNDNREYRYYLGAYGEDQSSIAILDMFPGGYFKLGTQKKGSSNVEYITGLCHLSEDNPSKNLAAIPPLEGTSRASDSQKEYLDESDNPQQQYQSIMQDWDYRSQRGRMIKAFPTYMLWLIDEGGRFAGMKLFDNLYGLNSILDFSVSQSAEDPMSDTLVLRLSNIYQKLTRSYSESIISEDDPLAETPIGIAIKTAENRLNNLNSGLFDSIVEIDHIRLKPGVRVHLRGGFSNNPNSLQTLFNGTITEVQAGEIMTVVAQSDSVELSSFVNSNNQSGHSGRVDGSMGNFWLSEPRDLIVRLLSIGSSNFKEWLSWGSRGVFFSESRFGIRHFGSILYEPMTQSEKTGQFNLQTNANAAANMRGQGTSGANFSSLVGEVDKITEITSIADLVTPTTYLSPMVGITQAMWRSQFAKRDYEVFRRNIYPGNGTGIAQFMGGDLIDAGIIVSKAQASEDENEMTDPLLTTPETASQQNSNWSTEELTGWAREAAGQLAARNNRATIDAFWKDYFDKAGLDQTELEDMLERSSVNSGSIDIDVDDGGGIGFGGLIGSILNVGWDVLTLDLGVENEFLQLATGFGNPFSIMEAQWKVGNGVINGLRRFSASPLGAALGLGQVVRDEDVAGFDEVSFRAQTYMKTVWDLFEVCAALLPNYIVAVRPFEDRSTLFYGKPHWLYTSGVIPVTTGVQTVKQARLEAPDSAQSALTAQVGQTGEELERFINTVESVADFRDISKFLANNIDPYAVGSTESVENLVTLEQIKALKDNSDLKADQDIQFLDIFGSIDYSTLTEYEITELIKYSPYIKPGLELHIEDLGDYSDSGLVEAFEEISQDLEDDGSITDRQDYYKAFVKAYVDHKKAKGTSTGQNLDAIKDIDKLVEEINADETITTDQKGGLLTLLNTDPITFAYHFGWKYSRTTIWIGTDANVGYDAIGDLARKNYDELYSPQVNSLGGGDGRSIEDAQDIWFDFRTVFRYRTENQDKFQEYFPLDADKDNYEPLMDLFMRFLWSDPFNRAWVVIKPPKKRGPLGDSVPGLPSTPNIFKGRDFLTGKSVEIDVGSKEWEWDSLTAAWEEFLKNQDVSFGPNNIPISPKTKAWMKANQTQGADADNWIEAGVDTVNDFFDENVGPILGLLGDAVTGLVATIRLSLMQLSSGLSMAGEQQRQANLLNASLNDSIYFQLGEEGSLLRAVDNCFTREYNEPVVEIREPFQRLHMVNSFSDILSNQIRENLNGVSTVVTCVSNGKNPVTVHMDKGVPPERQVEKVVESGLYWDNAVGNGFFGALQPLIHPLETARGLVKGITGTSDQLSARRVALYHLKNSVKKIYDGEIILLGSPDIRPWDLLYCVDNYTRMFGMVEVAQVIHHFTPETGFITSITPAALVTVNDPARWSMLSYLSNKMANVGMRDETRALLGVKTERLIEKGLDTISEEDLYNQLSNHVEGSVQWTQGSTTLVRDLGAVWAGGGVKGLTARDDAFNKAMNAEIVLGTFKNVAPIVVGGVTTIATGGNVAAGAVAAGAGWAVGQLAWEAWDYVKDNLLDQQGVMISFLNKDGQPMDAGLSYFQGCAVGSNHSLSLFPNVFGIPGNTVKINYRDSGGHYRITLDDLMGKLGWTEVETTAIYKDASMFINQVNTRVLEITNRGASEGIENDDFYYFIARVLEPDGELVESLGPSHKENGVIDGDTLHVVVVNPGNSALSNGEFVKIRVGSVNTSELQYKNNPYTDFNEVVLNPSNDSGRMAYEYLYNRFKNATSSEKIVAIRVRKTEPKDTYGRTIGIIFHNVRNGVIGTDRVKALESYASRNPPLPLQSYMEDGKPYTLNWELVMAGYGNVDMRDSLWDNDWSERAVEEF